MNRNMNRFVVYFVSMIIISLMLIVLDHYFMLLKQMANATFNILPLFIFLTVHPILIGILLKVPNLILNWKQTEWGLDWIKFLSVAPISLLLATHYIRVYFDLESAMFVNYVPDHLVITSGIIFGYVLVSSIRYDSSQA